MKTPTKKNHQDGFTLVELLVVIAIISLLMSLSLVAFSSARDKASNTKKITDVKAYTNALTLYYEDYGEYPGNNDWICLGDYADDNCWNDNNTPENSTINTSLSQYLPSLPISELSCGREGYVYQLQPNNHIYLIKWTMKGANQSCQFQNATAATPPPSENCTLCTLTFIYD